MTVLKPSQALREAVENHLWDGVGPLNEREICLCPALLAWRDAGRDQDMDARRLARDTAKCRIRERLGVWVVVPRWLFHVAEVPEEHLTWQQVQAYRKRWALHLADEFEKEGL